MDEDDRAAPHTVTLTARVTLRVDADWWFGVDPDVEGDAIADALRDAGFDVQDVRLAQARRAIR